MDTDV